MTIAYKIGDKDTRPWGTWEVLTVDADYIIKKITVMPNQSLSLQLHHHRNEHWIILKGNPTVTLGNEIKKVQKNETVYIPLETKHRMANHTTEPVVFIEIQTGKILDEADIVRFEDIYNRPTNSSAF